MKRTCRSAVTAAALLCLAVTYAAASEVKSSIYQVGSLVPHDSQLKIAVGDMAPDFELTAVTGEKITLSQYRGKKNVVISFVPAAWTPVCSVQWPMYDAAKDVFEENNAILLGITTDNIPSLYSWTKQIDQNGGGMWFPVLSDFYPHGAVAEKYGVLRSSGTSERTVFIVDKEGVVRYVEVYDINKLPAFDPFKKALEEVGKGKK